MIVFLFHYIHVFTNIIHLTHFTRILLGSGQSKLYSVKLAVDNTENKRVNLNWNVDGMPNSRVVYPNTKENIHVFQTGATQPADVVFMATDEFGNMVYLNNMPSIKVVPTEEELATQVFICKSQKNFP